MKPISFRISALLVCFAAANGIQAQSGAVIHKTNEYTIFANGVKQDKFSAKAKSAFELTSDYQSPKNESVSSKIEFKFSINGKDNEMKPGVNHYFNLADGVSETHLIKFGEASKVSAKIKETQLAPNRTLKIRLDLREVLGEMKFKGYYTAFNGDKIFKEDFKHVYIAGAVAPLSWDFDNLYQKSELELKDPDGDGIYETSLTFNAKKDQKVTATSWKKSKNTTVFPQYHSEQVLSNAIYNMSLEEMINAVEPDSTFRTGKEWAGVWTRDISYSIILSMAYLQPKVAMNSLMKKVSANKRIIQDTGTGGAYPASTDRMVWAIAAWEVYKATGDKKWLSSSYEIIKNSIVDDRINAYDKETGLVRGESSFLDWREQTYPKWMQPTDIFESENLGTNAVHYQANIIACKMAKLLKDEPSIEKYKVSADQIKDGINKYLWMPEKGFYAQYIYGRNYKMVSQRSEALGEALCILFGIADEAKIQSIISKTPQTAYGISCIYPQIPDIPPYHNNAVWPFVQSYWALASAKAGNQASVIESIAAIDRPAALFLTNKENFVADNGDFAGTQINSSNMLWSLSGNLGIIHKIIFGLNFEDDKIVFKPFVPKTLEGERTLINFKYRDLILDITINGYGNKIMNFMVDGKVEKNPEMSYLAKGRHTVVVELDNKDMPEVINKTANYFSPATPMVVADGDVLKWQKAENIFYHIVRNGVYSAKTVGDNYRVKDKKYAEYQVVAFDANGIESFASEPVYIGEKTAVTVEAESVVAKSALAYKGFSGNGFSETSKETNATINFPAEIPETGTYAIDFKYSNGNGPTNTENKCAIRSLKENGAFLGTLIFPQRGVQEWSNWGFSNSVKVKLEKGKHILTLSLDPANENMNGTVNQAMLDYLRVTKL